VLKETNCLKYYKAKNSQFVIKRYNKNLFWKQINVKIKINYQKHIKLITESDKALNTSFYGVLVWNPLSPTLFKIYVNEIVVRVIWNQIYTKGITLPVSTKNKTQPFADDQVIIADSEDNLQRGIFTLRNIAKNFGMQIWTEKSETLAFLGKDQVIRKIAVGNKC